MGYAFARAYAEANTPRQRIAAVARASAAAA
jgi:hypothetical protein